MARRPHRMASLDDRVSVPGPPIQTLESVVSDLNAVREYHVYIVGKTGEVLYSTGLIPALRARLPKAKLIWHVAEHYQPVLAFVEEPCRPDEVRAHVLPEHEDAAEAVRLAVTEGPHTLRGLVWGGDGILRANLYRTHPWYGRDPQKSLRRAPFWEHFAEAAGLPQGVWTPPGTFRRQGSGTTVLALPTANVHSRLRVLPAVSTTWSTIAQAAVARGFDVVANGHPADPLPEPMPGWPWRSPKGVVGLLELLRDAHWVIGLNSGATFAHLLLGPQDHHTSMLDPQGLALYRFDLMGQIVNRHRHRQLDYHPSMLLPGADGVNKIDHWLRGELERVLLR